MDVTLFLRPFTAASWVGICALLALILVLRQWADSRPLPALERSREVLALNWSLLFVLIQAFYGGALTMFFTTRCCVLCSTGRSIGIDKLSNHLRNVL